MANVYQEATAQAPSNVSTGDWTITVNGTYACGSTVQNYDLSAATMGSGRWVLVKANSVTGWAGATVTVALPRVFVGVSQEAVNFSGTTWQCVVVTLA